jgi:ABC-2 type transport system permease protein
MFTEIKHTLRRMRGTILGWGIGLFLYSLLMQYFFTSLEMMEGIQDMLDTYPPEMKAFFPNMTDMASPAGYIDTYFFSMMTLIIGIFAIGACAGLLVGHEEKGILDLLIAYPISRSGMFWGRFIGFMLATAAILIIAWLGWVIPLAGPGLGVSGFALLLSFFPLFAFLVLFGALTLLLSLLLPAARLAGGLSGGLLVANYLLVGLSGLNPDLKPLYKLTPMYFFQGGKAIEGLDLGALLGLLGGALLFALLAWWRFERREIRVGGEGGWSLPKLLLLGKKV